MKNKIHLLLTLTLPLLVLNCSVKPTPTSSPRTVDIPTQPTVIQPRPNLGTAISIPEPNKAPVLRPSAPQRPAPVVRQTAKHGQSYFTKKFKLPNSIKETSGLIKVDNRLWTHNDSGDKPVLYQINERNGKIIRKVTISNAHNKDWEDIAYDNTYIYIGDFGNNHGARKDLKIYKIPRASLRTQNSIRAEIIHFKYSDQKNFSSRPHEHNYDCEAMVAYNGKLYLFSKNWQNKKTRLYALNTQAGQHIARHISSFNTQGMVTAASINSELDILLLTTYSKLLDVNVWAFTNFSKNNFFNGDYKQLNFPSPLQGQVEAVTFIDNYKAYLSSETISKYIFTFPSSLYILDFSEEFE